jgi:hypothetical protein
MEKFKSIVDRPQASDMGDGFGHYEVAPGSTLKEFLIWFRENCKLWGTIKIVDRDGDIVRYFDYNTWSGDIVYTHLGFWQYDAEIEKIEFRYCFMNKDIFIWLK